MESFRIEMDNALARASAITDQLQKIEHYKYILSSVIASNDIVQTKKFIDHMVSDDVPLVVSQQLFQTFVQELGKLKSEAQMKIAHYALTQIQSRVVSFDDEQAIIIREKLAKLYESEGQWSKAAQMLSGIDLDSGIRMLDDSYKLSICVQIAFLYLGDDDAINAEAFINKASFLVSNSQHGVLNLHYKVCYARILDFKGKFLEAAFRYYDISQIQKRQIEYEWINEEVLEQALTDAVTCTILAAPGPRRSRVLATLYKDERCSKLKIYPILQKVYLERILRKPEIDAFAKELKAHQVKAFKRFEDDTEELQHEEFQHGDQQENIYNLRMWLWRKFHLMPIVLMIFMVIAECLIIDLSKSQHKAGSSVMMPIGGRRLQEDITTTGRTKMSEDSKEFHCIACSILGAFLLVGALFGRQRRFVRKDYWKMIHGICVVAACGIALVDWLLNFRGRLTFRSYHGLTAQLLYLLLGAQMVIRILFGGPFIRMVHQITGLIMVLVCVFCILQGMHLQPVHEDTVGLFGVCLLLLLVTTKILDNVPRSWVTPIGYRNLSVFDLDSPGMKEWDWDQWE